MLTVNKDDYKICRRYRTNDITLHDLTIIGWAIGLDYQTCKGISHISLVLALSPSSLLTLESRNRSVIYWVSSGAFIKVTDWSQANNLLVASRSD